MRFGALALALVVVAPVGCGFGGKKPVTCNGVPGLAIGLVFVCSAVAVAKFIAALYNCLLLSSLGRNLRGVWYTFGALEGGLKMSVGRDVSGVYEGALGRARSFLWRRAVDSHRFCVVERREGRRCEGVAGANGLHGGGIVVLR